MSCNDSLEARLKARALAEGFSDCRIASADTRPDLPEKLAAWLADGRHGTMAWMEARSEQRADPVTLWPQVRSVIMLGMSYAPADDPIALAKHPEKARFSVYARGRDYHDVIKRALKSLARWLAEESGAGVKVFVDTAPVMEKPLAEAAGLGWQGKHTNLVSQSAGSWLFLGAIYTTAPLSADAPGRDRCGSCTACQDICPTAAFPAPYQLDARRCISYLTIEHDGPIDAELRPLIGNHVYGCDDCLAVCPWNKFASAAQANRAFLPRAELTAPDLADLLSLDDASFRAIFSGSPIKRSGRRRIVRNAAIAAGNSGSAALLPYLVALLSDDEPQVRGAVIWAVGRLDAGFAAKEAASRAAAETDPSVRAEWAALPVVL